jgi:hypothetical protein
MAERGNSVVRSQVESTPYTSVRPNRRSALARNCTNLAGRGTSSLLCMVIVGGVTRRMLMSHPRGVWDTIFVIEIPEVVRHQAVNVGADDWLANLNDIVAELATSWNITVEATFPDATEAYVAEAVKGDGELLKTFR